MKLKRGELEVLPNIDLIFALEMSRKNEIENYSRSPGLHISEIGHAYARACNRFYAYALLDEERTVGDRKWLLGRFEVGHAYHEYAYRSIRRALKDYFEGYLGDYRVISIDVEKKLPTTALAFTGTPDVVVTLEMLKRPGEWIRFVIDVKSISKKEFEKKQTPKGMTVPLDYKHQLQHYIEMCHAHFGIIYWVCIQHPYPQRTSFVGRNKRLFDANEERMRNVIRSLVDKDEMPAASPGPHCRECSYKGVCEFAIR